MRYPVYVISKGRWEKPLTGKFLVKDNVDFRIVVEPTEYKEYLRVFGAERVAKLPFVNKGMGGIPARNWCWEDSKSRGYDRHWILDDNIRNVVRLYKGIRIVCDSGPAFSAIEDFTDRYENIGISGMNYRCFGVGSDLGPYTLNSHVYSCLLIDNSLPYRWRGRYNEDTDLCLQVLSGGLCTVLVNTFLIDKAATMTMKGGNSDTLYKDDGRLKMAKSLERVWPGVVTVKRRFGRPQHVVDWKRFKTRLVKKASYRVSDDPEYGLSLVSVSDVKSRELRDLVKR